MDLSAAILRPSPKREIALVLGVPVALFLASSVSWRLRGASGMMFTDRRLVVTLLIEAILAAGMVRYLWNRGWRPADVAGIPEPQDILRGFGLWLAAVTAYGVIFLGLYLIVPSFVAPIQKPQFTGSLSPLMILVAALVNPIFEEFLWLAYAIPALGSRYGLRVACVISVALRVMVHAYQGRLALIAILPLGAIFTWYYVRSGRLWPVVVAHVVVDALGLSSLMSTA